MAQKILIFKIIAFCYFFFHSICFAEIIVSGKAKIIDGDTIHIGNNKIRLHGIDAPEINQQCVFKKENWNCGIESRLALKKLITTELEIECKITDVDKYKRLIGICFLNNLNINQFMVSNGWAIAYRYYSLDYIRDEELAKKNKFGIWRGDFQEPYLYRKNNK